MNIKTVSVLSLSLAAAGLLLWLQYSPGPAGLPSAPSKVEAKPTAKAPQPARADRLAAKQAPLVADTKVPPRKRDRRQEAASVHPLDFDAMVKILESRRDKALLTPAELAEQRKIVDSAEFQQEIFESLRASDVKKFAFAEEKHRMAMQVHLSTIARFGSPDSQKKLKTELSRLILSKNYAQKPDIKLKKSLVGDKIEYLRFVKRHYPELYERLAADINSSGDDVLGYALSKA